MGVVLSGRRTRGTLDSSSMEDDEDFHSFGVQPLEEKRPARRPSVVSSSKVHKEMLDLPPQRNRLSLDSRLGKTRVADVPQQGRILRWKRGAVIGSGSYGTVSLGMNSDTGELFVVKEVIYSPSEDTESINQLDHELQVLSQLRHKHIVRYLGTEKDPEEGTLRIFLEHMPGGCIADLLKKFGPFDISVIRKYTRETLSGMIYLHSHHIVHRDIKGQNILVDNAGTCKLADFGCCKLVSGGAANSFKGTPVFMAPEVIQNQAYGEKADIWSLGCTVIQMATARLPFSQFSNHIAALFHITSSQSPPPMPEDLPQDMLRFLDLCFQRDPADRPTAEELLQHEFLTSTTSAPTPKPLPPKLAPTSEDSKSGPSEDSSSLPRSASPQPTSSGQGSSGAHDMSGSNESTAPVKGSAVPQSRRSKHVKRKEKWKAFMRSKSQVADVAETESGGCSSGDHPSQPNADDPPMSGQST